ncbi:site-specific integrase [Flavobacterium sp. 7A]|uniref:site-specific integrase n=1 Tax=Flavobacterium sp. 7A TaxID=2940571 RepID=UPI00222749E9|nr:site-specific integrase [Flavobacterium sp. 7A]MCW2120641.1 site-specific recombinase XerD [Flavobacterium sp. 7A]
MLKVNFYLKADKANKSGLSPIYAKVILNNKSTTISTGKMISRERWQSTNNLRTSLRLENEKIIRNALEIFKLNLERRVNDLSKFGSEVSLEILKAGLRGKLPPKKKSVGIIEIIEKHNVYFKKKADAGDRAPASLQKYERAKTLLSTFLKKHYQKNEMDLNTIDEAFIFSLESFLRYDSEFKGVVGIKNNSVVKYMRMFKTACKHAIRTGSIEKNPFDVYEGKLKVCDSVFLTQEELNAIESKEFGTERLQRVKDIFLFSCYTGYAPTDATSLNETNIIKDSSDSLWIMTKRAKTDIRANVPLLPPAIKIIDKYRGKQTALLPSISNQKMNAYLKEIGDVCNIQKKLTWYVARHTFATTVTLGNGVRIENVSAMMGHTNIKQTQHYAKVMDQNVLHDMEILKGIYQ